MVNKKLIFFLGSLAITLIVTIPIIVTKGVSKNTLDILFYITGGTIVLGLLIWVAFIYKPRTNYKNFQRKLEEVHNEKVDEQRDIIQASRSEGKTIFLTSLLCFIPMWLIDIIVGIVYATIGGN